MPMTCARARVCVACSGISGPDTRDGYSATRRAMLEDTRPFPFLRGPRPRRPLSLRPLDTFADCSPGWTSTRRTCSGRAWRSAAAGLRTSQTALGRAASCRQTRACGGARTGIAATREGHRGLLRLRRTPGGRRGWLSGGAVTGHPPPAQWDNTNLHSGGETIDSRVDACRVFRSSGSRRHHHRTRPQDVVVPLATGEPGVTAGGARAFLPSAGNTRSAMAQLRRRRH